MAKSTAPKTKPTTTIKPKPVASKMIGGPVKALSAEAFIKKLKTITSAAELKKIRGYFKSGEGQYAEGDKSFVTVNKFNDGHCTQQEEQD